MNATLKSPLSSVFLKQDKKEGVLRVADASFLKLDACIPAEWGESALTHVCALYLGSLRTQRALTALRYAVVCSWGILSFLRILDAAHGPDDRQVYKHQVHLAAEVLQAPFHSAFAHSASETFSSETLQQDTLQRYHFCKCCHVRVMTIK